MAASTIRPQLVAVDANVLFHQICDAFQRSSFWPGCSWLGRWRRPTLRGSSSFGRAKSRMRPAPSARNETACRPKLDRKQVEVTEPTRMITDVTKPTITIYRPAQEKDTGTAMLICPGGGYWNLYWQLEGEEVAAWLNSIGVTGIILKYRVPRRPDEPPREPARRPLQDAQRAVSLVRSKAKELGLDPDRIGIVGFSAGGHLAIATATEFREANLRADRRR